MSNAVSVTTPTHAFAEGGYLIALLLGIAQLTGFATATGLTAAITAPGVMIWAGLMAFSGGWGLYAIRKAVHSRVPTSALKEESVAAGVMGVTLIMYEVSLLFSFGLSSVITTQIIATVLGVSAIRRVWQIRREVKKVEAALVDPQEATPAPLAEATEQKG